MKVDVIVADGDAIEQTRQWMRRRMAGTWVGATWWDEKLGAPVPEGMRWQVPPAPHPEERTVERFHQVSDMPLVYVEAWPSERDAYADAIRSRLNRPLDWVDRFMVASLLAVGIGGAIAMVKLGTLIWGWVARWV